jgi:hypothetical protein
MLRRRVKKVAREVWHCRFRALPNDQFMLRVMHINENWEATMKYHDESNRDPLRSNDQGTCIDYSEEAIPERDPAYRLPAGTLYQTHTIDYVPAAKRHALARRLQELGMSPARAAMVASLG